MNGMTKTRTRARSSSVLTNSKRSKMHDDETLPINPLTGEHMTSELIEMISDLTDKLPILQKDVATKLFKLLKDNQVVILSADTGAGKTTQVPKMMLEFFGYKKRVVCTQPRQIPTVSLAKSVSHQLGATLGKEVGYQYRGKKVHSGMDTMLTFMTEGVLMRKFLNDKDQQDLIGFIIDEAHERNVETDMLMLMIRDVVLERPDVRAIVMSATAETDRFLKYFKSAKVKAEYMHVSGMTYPIEHRFSKDPVKDYVSESVEVALGICGRPVEDIDNEDIMIFYPAKSDLDRGMNYLARNMNRVGNGQVAGYRLSADTPEEEAGFHVDPKGTNGYASSLGVKRKIIFSTNVAETSITVPTLKYVIDSGKAIQQGYDETSGVPFLEKGWISKANIKQRAGRSGRTQPGICYHLYTEKEHEGFDDFGKPSIHTEDTAGLFLDVLYGFPEFTLKKVYSQFLKRLIDPPKIQMFRTIVERLAAMGTIDGKTNITPAGRCIAELSILGPEMSYAVLRAKDYGVQDEMLALASMMMEFKRADDAFIVADDDKGSKIWPAASKMKTDTAILLDIFKKFQSVCQGEGWRNRSFDWAKAKNLHAMKWRRVIETFRDAKRNLLLIDEGCVVGPKGNGIVECVRDCFPRNVTKWDTKYGAHTIMGGTPVKTVNSRLFPHIEMGLRNKSYVFLNLTRNMGVLSSSMCIL